MAGGKIICNQPVTLKVMGLPVSTSLPFEVDLQGVVPGGLGHAGEFTHVELVRPHIAPGLLTAVVVTTLPSLSRTTKRAVTVSSLLCTVLLDWQAKARVSPAEKQVRMVARSRDVQFSLLGLSRCSHRRCRAIVVELLGLGQGDLGGGSPPTGLPLASSMVMVYFPAGISPERVTLVSVTCSTALSCPSRCRPPATGCPRCWPRTSTQRPIRRSRWVGGELGDGEIVGGDGGAHGAHHAVGGDEDGVGLTGLEIFQGGGVLRDSPGRRSSRRCRWW